MLPKRIDGFTRVFNAPQDWNQERDGMCGVLPIRDTMCSDGRYMVSNWEPTPAELAALNAGAGVQLWIRGSVHPVVSLTVSE